MYLIARPRQQAQILQDLLAQAGIAASHLPLMELIPTAGGIDTALSKLPQAKALLVVSPSAIELLAAGWSNLAADAQIFCVGRASGELMAKFTANPVNFPHSGAGVTALIGEELLLSGKIEHLVVIGGDKINAQLADYLQSQAISYEFISLYQRENYWQSAPQLIEELITNPAARGIIVTSRQIAEYLLSGLQQHPHLWDKVAQLAIISLHQQISSYLKDNGFKHIYQTQDSSNHAIVELIKNLMEH